MKRTYYALVSKRGKLFDRVVQGGIPWLSPTAEGIKPLEVPRGYKLVTVKIVQVNS